ncbi:MAG: response regulator [Dokdonella sp.]
MLRVALIDDHELVRTGYRLILSAQPDIEIVGEAEDGQSGLLMLKRLEPDVALVDVQMPGLSGIEVTDRVRRSNLRTRIVIVSMVSESPFPRRLLAAGASGYVTKGCSADELIKAIRTVADGRRYLAAKVAERLALDALDGNTGSPFEALTTRELEVAMMLSNGRDMQQIAKTLKLSVKTVATYKYRLFEKMDIDNTVALAHLAGIHGLLEGQQFDK